MATERNSTAQLSRVMRAETFYFTLAETSAAGDQKNLAELSRV